MALSGPNRPPVVTGPIVLNITEDVGPGQIPTNTNTFDPDMMDLVLAVDVPAILPAGITYDPQFNWFVIDSHAAELQSLAAGQVSTSIVNFFVTDRTAVVAHSLILNVTGVNDTAVIGGTIGAALSEDGVTSAAGTLTVLDVDTGEAAFQPVDAQVGTYGSLWLAANGQWSYILNNNAAAVQALVTGQNVVDLFTVHSVDGTEQAITINISGADETFLVGTAGNDLINGLAFGELIMGLAGRDTVHGNGGDDTLDGGLGADNLNGGDGNDVIFFDASDRAQNGGTGVDTLAVSRAATVNLASADQISGDQGIATGFENVDGTFATVALSLTGSGGANILAGGAAADRLTGGLGADILTGNGGADRFAFRSLSDSQGLVHDEIADFAHGLDKIDLSVIDAIAGGRNNAFAFIGGAAFSRAGQLRYDATSGVIEADTNGDRLADFTLDVGAGLTITGSDFLL